MKFDPPPGWEKLFPGFDKEPETKEEEVGKAFLDIVRKYPPSNDKK